MNLKETELQRLHKGEDPLEVLQEYFDEGLNGEDLPFEQFCNMGGAPDSEEYPEVHVLNVQIEGNECIGTLTVYFDEVVYGGGCPDMPTVNPRQGDIGFKISLSDGSFKFD